MRLSSIRLALAIVPRVYRPRLLGAFCLSLVLATVEILTATSIYFSIAAILNQPLPTEVSTMLARISQGSADEQNQIERNLILVSVYMFAIRALLQYFSVIVIEHTKRKIVMNVTNALFRGYLRSPYETISKMSAASLLNRVTVIPMNAVSQCTFGLVEISTSIGLILFYTLLLMVATPVAALSALGILASLGIIYILSIYRVVGQWGFQLMNVFEDLYQSAKSMMESIKIIRVFSAERKFSHEFSQKMLLQVNTQAKIAVVNQLPRITLEFFVFVGIFTVLLFTFDGERGAVGYAPDLVLFAMAALRLLPAVSRLITGVQNFRNKEPFLTEIGPDVLRFSLRPIQSPEPMPERPASVTTKDPFLSLTIRNVSFQHSGVAGKAVDDVSIDIVPGTFLGLVGASGSGKTTTADIILGLLQPSAGEVLLNGVAVTQEGMARLDHIVSYVPQETVILPGTLRENIAFGQLRHEVDDSQVYIALEQAALLRLVDHLPDGIDTVIGTKGRDLSGGEKQRVSIARALYSGAEVLVLDEATAALDVNTEAEVVDTILQLRDAGKAIVFIGHRLYALQKCDELLVFDNGRVVARGSFQDLASENAAFTGMLKRMEIDG